jgi:putrescine transport system ATP-binding protein
MGDPKPEPMIRFVGVAKRFGDIVAVDDLTFRIHEREFFCLPRPVGLRQDHPMRMLAGFEAPTAGR